MQQVERLIKTVSVHCLIVSCHLEKVLRSLTPKERTFSVLSNAVLNSKVIIFYMSILKQMSELNIKIIYISIYIYNVRYINTYYCNKNVICSLINVCILVYTWI